MTGEAEDLTRRAAYLDTLRRLYSRTKFAGYVLCLVGILVLVWAKFRGPGPLSPIGIAGIVIVTAGWAIFVYVIVQRTRYVRRHPYNPQD
ncbi:MAG: hypothetical protein U1E50_11910 [Caulobacteraceae bacterium]